MVLHDVGGSRPCGFPGMQSSWIVWTPRFVPPMLPSVDLGFGSLDLSMDGNVEVVLAKGDELVDDNLSAGCVG